MSPADLLLELQRRGIRAWVEGNRLVLEPYVGLPAELRAALDERRAELVELLAPAVEGAAAPPLEVVPREGPLPVSFAQQRLWFMTQLGGDSSAQNSTLTLRLRGDLDVAALRWSLGEIARRHEVLRASVRAAYGEPVLVVAPPERFTLEMVDLPAHGDGRREVALLAQAESERAFDLEAGPLWRAVLARLAADDHALCISMHHLVTDRQSWALFGAELSELYEARVQGRQPALPALRIGYADYAVWQRRRYEQGAARLLGYWRAQLENLPTLDLPADRPRPARQTFAGAELEVELDARDVAAIKAVGRAERCTFFATMLAVFKVLLARRCAQQDVVVGTPVANRDDVDLEPLIGPFVNNLVLRTDLSGDPTFRELLRRVREVALDAIGHQEMPFEQLVFELRPERDLSRNPLFQVLFNVLDDARPPRLGNLAVETVAPEKVATMFDLSLILHGSDPVLATFEYNTDLFDAATIQRMAGELRVLLASLAAEPDRSVWVVPLLTGAEREQVLVAFNRTAADYPRDRCWHRLFEARAASAPSRVAAVCEGAALTYGELDTRANQLARHLRGLGAAPGVAVGVALPRSLDALVALLGVMKSGAAYVPLDLSYPRSRLELLLQDSGAALLVTTSAAVGALPAERPPLVRLDADAAALAAHRAEPLAAACDPDPEQAVYLLYTSGSTGRPKAVEVPHRALVNCLASMAREPGLGAADVLLAVTSISFDIAALELFLPLSVGARVAIATEDQVIDGGRLAAAIAAHGVTALQATPSTWRLLLEAGWDGLAGGGGDGSAAAAAGARRVVDDNGARRRLKALCGGEAMPRDLARRLLGLGVELWNLYGPTETTIWSLVHRVASAEAAIPIGQPIANTQAYILDRWLQPVPIGVTGELYLGGDGLARGYWRRPDLTAECFVQAPPELGGGRLYRTGDMARRLASGDIEFLGRADQQVKVRGFRIELEEIEHVLAAHPAVQRCVVVVQTKSSGGESLAAHVAYAPGATATATELRAMLRQRLPEYMVPSTITAVSALPLTPNGKVDRKALASADAARTASAAGLEDVRLRTDTERRVAEIWREVLEVEHVGRLDNFFDLGGHSLLAMRVVARVKRDLGVQLAPMDLLVHSLQQLAAAVDERRGGSADADRPAAEASAMARNGGEPDGDARPVPAALGPVRAGRGLLRRLFGWPR